MANRCDCTTTKAHRGGNASADNVALSGHAGCEGYHARCPCKGRKRTDARLRKEQRPKTRLYIKPLSIWPRRPLRASPIHAHATKTYLGPLC